MKPAKIAGRPIHPMLVMLPVGVWVFSLICQIVYAAGGSPQWETAATFNIAAGIVFALIAAISGFVDLFALPDSRAKTLAYWHMSLNLTITVLFAIALYSRVSMQSVSTPLILSIIASGLLLVSGWLGFTMVFIHGVGTPGGMKHPEEMLRPGPRIPDREKVSAL